MSLSQLQADWSAARTALLAADYDTALRYALAVQGALLATPDQRHGDRSLGFRQQDVSAFIAEVKELRKEARLPTGGVQRTKITYTRTDQDDGY